jgi:hypothetical protein
VGHTFSGNELDRAEAERRDPAWVADFDREHGSEETRFQRLKLSLAAKREVIRKNRDLIAQRINTVASLLDRAALLDPSMGAAPVLAATPAQAAAAPAAAHGAAPQAGGPARPRRVRRVRIVRRR